MHKQAIVAVMLAAMPTMAARAADVRRIHNAIARRRPRANVPAASGEDRAQSLY
jgi:hypothetical protein